MDQRKWPLEEKQKWDHFSKETPADAEDHLKEGGEDARKSCSWTSDPIVKIHDHLRATTFAF